METTPPPVSPPTSSTPKKGLGTGAKIGIGCAGIVGLAIIGFIVVGIMFGPKMKKFVADAQQNPTRATAAVMVSTGAMEMVAEDDVNKRYTIKEKKSGALTTVYWSEKKGAPEVIPGDFSAIPPNTAPGPESPPTPDADKK